MMNMKTIFKYILAAAMTLSFAACQEEPFSPGEPDLLDCQGLFFPQEQAKAYEVTPEGAKYLTFTVERNPAVKNYFPEAYVPYELTSSEEGFFELEDEFIYFDEDQESTSFKVYFSEDFETGKKYTCTIKVTDPQYVSNYGLSSNELTFSLTVVKWELLGEGLWRDDFFTSFCSEVLTTEIKAPYHEKPVEIYQREDLPGYYRVDKVYTADYVSYLSDGTDRYAASYSELCPGGSIYVNASDPSRVYIDAQLAFNHASYGGIYIASYVSEVFIDAGDQYGTLKDGVITFPKSGLVAYVPAAGGFAYANISGKHRIVLPGYKPYDYSLEVETSPAVKGVMPVTFTFGSDVAKVQYKVFPGHVSDAEMVSKLEDVKSGKDVKTVTESGEYEFTTGETGLYTLIACSYDAAGNFKEYTYVKFGYDTEDDPKDVDIHMGLIVSDKYAGAGLTKENAMEFYLYGTELTEVKVAMYKKVHYEDFREAIEAEFDYYIAPVDREVLAQVNSSGYSGVISGLTAGTEYILIVYAANGYHSGVFTTTEFTAGEFDLMDAEFGIYDLPGRFQPEDDKSVYFQKWDVWSLDPYKDNEWGRTKRATAEIVEDEDLMLDVNGNVTEDPKKAETTMDYVKLSGMYPDAAKKYGFKDEIQLEFYDGFVYTIMTQMEPGEYNGKPVYPTNAYLFFDGSGLSAYLENGAMIGGFVTEEQDVIAFVGNPRTEAGSYGFTYVAMMLCYFTSPDYSGEAPLITENAHAYPLLVSPDSKYADYGADAASLKAPAACNKVSAELSKPRTNYVETDRGYIRSTIDAIKGTPYNYMQNTFDVSDIFFEIEPVSFTMTKSN